MALFRYLGSRHIRMLPSFFVLYTMLEHQSVCSLTRLMTPVFSICLSSSLIWGRRFTLHFLGLSMCGIASGRTWMYAGSLNCPMRSNCSGYFFFRSLIGLTVSIWWTSTRRQVMATSPSFSQAGRPRITGSGHVDYVELCIIPCASLVFAVNVHGTDAFYVVARVRGELGISGTVDNVTDVLFWVHLSECA